VCPGEWVYHYVDTSLIAGAGHYGPGHHLRFTLDKSANEGAAVAMTRHSNVVKVPSCRCHNSLAWAPQADCPGSLLRCVPRMCR
jgi:hypothetical protein